VTSSDLSARVAYLVPAIGWAARWATLGPSWLPLVVRKMPLALLAAAVYLHSRQ